MNEIRLGHVGNKTYTFLDALSQEEYQEIINAIDVLNKYKFSKNLFKVFDTNYNEL
jgi:hypothetical protein